MSLYSVGTYVEHLGGWVAAYISLNQDGSATHALIISDASDQSQRNYTNTGGTWGAEDSIDGPGIHQTALAAGSGAHQWVETNFNDTAYGGHSDWYIGAPLEWGAIFWELKPTTEDNATSPSVQYDNPYAVPQYVVADWSATNPPQTNVAAFETGGAQAIESSRYFWTCWKSGSSTVNYIRTSDSSSCGGLGAGTGSFGRIVRPIRRAPVSQLVQPPSDEEVFEASFEDASGRDPLPTALIERTPARQLANHLLQVYLYPPYMATKRVPIELEDYDKAVPGNMMWHKDEDDPLFNMGRWGQIQGVRWTDNPLEVELTIRISDHPESFEEPT